MPAVRVFRTLLPRLLERLMSVIPETRPTKVIESPGYCIYCGASDGPLTDEHIIPRGMNGHVLLKGATCNAHQKLTSAIEGDIQAADKNGMFADTRLILGMRSYKKRKERPTEVKVTFIGHDGRKFRKNVPIKDAQAMHVMPVFVAPRFLSHPQPLPNSKTVELSAIANNLVGPGIERLVQRYGARSIEGRVIVPMGSFLRFLCKIAFGVHFVERGPFERIESPALALLIGERHDFGNWIGCVPHENEVPGTDWHRIEIANLEAQSGESCEAVLISLLNNLAPCTYIVVTRFPDYQSMVE